jgi:hypothetical protein
LSAIIRIPDPYVELESYPIQQIKLIDSNPQPANYYLVFARCVADLGSHIPDPATAPKEEREKVFCPTFFVATNIIKLKIILVLNR